MNNSVFAASILLGLSFAAFPAYAQTVKTWVDEDGITHYSDQKPSGGEADVKEVEVPKANVTEFETEEANERIQKQLQQLEQDRKAREQAAQAKERAKAVEEAVEREPLVAEEKKKKKDKGGSRYSGPYPRPLPTYPRQRPGSPDQN